MSFLSLKTARTALLYVLFCGMVLAFTRTQRLALCADWRFAALRELQKRGAGEVIFLGSSRTARGVIPSVFEEEFSAQGGEKTSSLNLAVMGQPRHVNYLQLASYLRDHAPPRILCIEVGDIDFDDREHPTLTRFMTPRDALRVAWYRPYRTREEITRDDEAGGKGVSWLDAVLAGIARQSMHLELALDAVGRGPEDLVRTGYNLARNGFESGAWLNPYWALEPPISMETLRDQLEKKGWYLITPEARDAIEGPEKVRKKAGEVSLERALELQSRKNLQAPGKYRFTRIYTRKLFELCRKHGIRPVFMELPAFRQPTLSDSQVAFYESRGDLFRPDRRALYAAENYMDPGHLNSTGAELYTRELARFLAAQP